MSYASVDNSVHDGAPIECYKFTGELGTYRYTNANRAVTVAGEVYTPLSGLTRTAIETASLLDNNQTIDIKMPITTPMAEIYNFLKMPLTLDVQIRAVHEGTDFATDSKIIWRGEAIQFGVARNEADTKTQSIIQSGLSRQLNQVLFQTTCNHTVYDEMCGHDGLAPAAFTTISTITNIKDNVLKVVSTGRADGFLAVGKMVNTRTGESRVIVSNVGAIVTVGYPFLDIVLGDTVDMIVGCNNAYSTCLNVFNNTDNFSGFMFLPETNPYVNPV